MHTGGPNDYYRRQKGLDGLAAPGVLESLTRNELVMHVRSTQQERQQVAMGLLLRKLMEVRFRSICHLLIAICYLRSSRAL